MNRDVLCICYSRTGKTKQTMSEIAQALDCELILFCDRINRRGVIGWVRCGLDAMRRKTYAITQIQTVKPLWEYRLVILGTPVWAGRCSSVMRGLLKRRGHEMPDVAYVITHRSDEPYREIFAQMDQYLLKPHVADVSLRPGSTGYVFWRNQFLKTCSDLADVALCPIDGDAGANRETAEAAGQDNESQ